jgi:phage anti-repressor protein
MSEKLILESQVEKLVEQTYHADDEFCIDLDALFENETGEMIPIWQWAGFARKDAAKRRLKNLVESVDFLLHSEVERNSGSGGQNKIKILLTKDGFKQLLMLANTERGKQIRLYFIDVEKRYGREIKQTTPIDQIISKVIGAFDQINHQLTQNKTDQLITNQILHEYEERHNKSEERHDKTEIKVDLLEKKIKKFESRKDPKKVDKDSCMKLIKDIYYNNSCPCCGLETKIWEYDHFYDSSKNHLTEIWPVCKPCNQKLGTGGDLKKGSFRKDHEIKFETFQQLLEKQNKPNVIQEELF